MNPDATPESGVPTPLEYAMDQGHFDVAAILIRGGANVKHSLLIVARSGNLQLFQMLMNKKPSREALSGALYQAAEAGNIEIVKQLLHSGLTPNDGWGGNLPLGGAAYEGRIEVVKLLLDHGADVNAVNRSSGGNGETALHYATRCTASSALKIVELLLASGAHVNVNDQRGATPLMNALDHREMALMLLAHGAAVNSRDKDGNTALMYAAARHLTAMVRTLVKEGADINAQNNDGRTALMNTSGAADSVDDPDTVQAALDSGANPNQTDRDGYTALMFAAQKRLNGAKRVLIAAGADKGKRNKDGKTAMELTS
jgi:serine/threonine-protein phosphatase 6 regulatory ankyrin repeat subunit B